MARFYQTANVAPMDYMYQMNIPLMQQALQANELGLNQQIERGEQIGAVASKFPYLTPDSQRAAEISNEYEKKVSALTKAIQEDPTNWRKKKGEIRDLARQLEQNYKTGEISKIAGNYSKYKELDDYITKREEAGKLTPYEGSAFRAKALESLKGGTAYNPQTGIYEQISTVKPMDTINVRERLSKFVDDLKKNEQLEWDSTAGQYFKKTTEGREWISPDRIIAAATQGLMGDTELQQYLKQRSDFGLMSGVFDKEGKFINPYSTQTAGPNEIEKQQISEAQTQIAALRKTNPQLAEQKQQQLQQKMQQLARRQTLVGNTESSLYPTIQSLANEYSYDSVKRGVDLKNNSLYNLGISQNFQAGQNALNRKQKQDMFDQKMGQADQFFKDKMELEWFKAMNNGKTPATSKTGTKKSTTPTEPPRESTTGFNDASPFTDDPFYSVSGLSTTIDSNKQYIDNMTKKSDAYKKQIDSIMKGRTLEQLSPQEKSEVTKLQLPMDEINRNLVDKASELDLARQWYGNSTEAALNSVNKVGLENFSPREKELYKLSVNPAYVDKLRKEVDEIKSKTSATQQMSYTGPGMGGTLSGGRTNEQIAKINLLNQIDNVKKRVDEQRESYLTEAKEKTRVITPAIVFGEQDSKDIAKNIENKTYGLSLFNSKGQQDGGLGIIDSKGVNLNPWKSDNHKATFAGGDLWTYLKQNDGEIQYLSVSPTMRFGSNTGATMKVRFKNTKNPGSNVGDIPSNEDFYVTLDPQSQIAIGEKYATSKDQKIAELGRTLLDGRDQQIRNKLINVRTETPEGQFGLARRVEVPTSLGNLPIIVQEFHNSGDNYDYYITLRKADGSEVPMRSSSSTGAGWFSSIEQFIADLDKNVQEKKLE